MKAKHVIADRPGLNAAWARKASGQHAAEGLVLGAQQRLGVERFEGEVLVCLDKCRLDLGQGRSSAGGQDQFGGIIGQDAGQAAEIQKVAVHRFADGAF